MLLPCGPTLSISTNGETTTGIFLDPNGRMQINHSVLNGQFWPGDAINQRVVSWADINAPASGPTVPEPTKLALVLSGLVPLGLIGLYRR
jgi:hypothetical protein